MLQFLDGSDYSNMAVNDNLYVNISSPTAVITFKRDIGVQWNVNDITIDSYEIPKFSKCHDCLKKSVKTGVDGIQNVRKQIITTKQCFII